MIQQLFAYPFRIFFLSAGAYAALVIPCWLVMLFGIHTPPVTFAALFWHQHEMLFGFLEAAIAGFLLTAVCNWTGTERLHGASLAALWALWLAGRVLMLAGALFPAWIVHAVDLAFLPAVMADAGRRIVAVRQWRQAVILAVLGGLWLMEIGFHLAPGARFTGGALLLAMTLMLVIGGRITPAFSGNWLRLNGRDPSAIRIVPALERLVLISMVAVLVLHLAGFAPGIRGFVALVAAATCTVRLVLWRGWIVRDEPLLWILHVALAWIPLALLLYAAEAFGLVASTAWVHAAGTGAMGSLILGVMTRVALGHTGRPLHLPPGMVAGYYAVLGAGIVRVATALGWLPWRPGLLVAAALWEVAFVLFVVRYARVLASPRADGKPG